MSRPEVLPAQAPTDDVGADDVLALYEIRKSWAKRPVLDGIDLVVQAGTVIWVGGANGAGKTTLFRIASGLIQPDSGIVRLRGLHPERNRREYLKRIGFLTAGDRGLYARLSPRRHLEFCARLAMIPRAQRDRAVEWALDQFAITHIADRRSDRLSMGQRQRVRLAMTFIHNPELVLLDEPANSLDLDGIAVLRQYIEEVTARGGAVLWCSPVGIDNPIEFDARYMLADGDLSEA